MAEPAPFDPYRPPSADVDGARPLDPGRGFFARQDGELLVVQKGASLPQICLKCGTIEGLVRRRQDFQWIPPWAFAAFVLNALIAAILIFALRKRGELDLALCKRCSDRWKRARRNINLSVACMIVALAGGIWLITASGSDGGGIPGIALIVSGLGASIAVGALHRKDQLITRKIDKEFITLAGVAADARGAIVKASWGR